MIGAIIGDIVGSRFEFNNTSDSAFSLFSEDCDFTDDTICTIAIADAILKEFSYKDSILYWCRKYPNPMGSYGGSFARWIHSSSPKPYNSFGNGSAMRVSPIAWSFDNLNEVLDESEKTASITHNHPEGIKGAKAIAHVIYHLRSTNDLSGVKRIGNLYYPNFMNEHFPQGVFNETCQGTVPLALQIFLSSDSFEDAIRRAILHGGDSDTIGAIVGSLAESYYGVPEWIENKALSFLPDEMIKIYIQFKNKYQK